VVPWTGFWDRNYFVVAWPTLRLVLHNDFVRGAISGVGVVNVCAGFVELASMFVGRRR
jgi:hypothetical protein